MIEEWVKIYSKEVLDLKLDKTNIMPQQKKQIMDLFILCKLVYNNFKEMMQNYEHKYNQKN